MECVRTGGGSPRMFETFTQISKNIMDINKQIVSTEAVLRQMYINLKGEIMDINRHKENLLEDKTAGKKQLHSKTVVQSPKDLINSLHQNRKDEIIEAKYYEEE